MKVYYSLDKFPVLKKPIVTIGNFDGVHLGHFHVLQSLVNQSTDGFESVVITFWPHPRKVLDPNSFSLQFLTSIEEKITLIERIGISHLLILPFNLEMGEMTANHFVEEILIKRVGSTKIVLGYDHRFGKDRLGGLDYLIQNNEKYNLILEEIPEKEVENIGISSSKIKSFLNSGKIEEANTLLGRNYSISGVVCEGKKLGRTIGFPTANIQLDFSEKLVPATGVYAVRINIDNDIYKGMMNIGNRPTVSGDHLTLEVNIFDFNQDIYKKKLTVEFVQFIRKEQKFESLEFLKMQLHQDKSLAFKILQ